MIGSLPHGWPSVFHLTCFDTFRLILCDIYAHVHFLWFDCCDDILVLILPSEFTTLFVDRYDDQSPTDKGRHLRGGRVLQRSLLAHKLEGCRFPEFLDCAEKLLDLAEKAGYFVSRWEDAQSPSDAGRMAGSSKGCRLSSDRPPRVGNLLWLSLQQGEIKRTREEHSQTL